MHRETAFSWHVESELISCTLIKHQSPVVPVERSMSDMMHMLGLAVTGGRHGTIRMFKEQIIRFAACHFTIVGPGPKGSRSIDRGM